MLLKITCIMQYESAIFITKLVEIILFNLYQIVLQQIHIVVWKSSWNISGRVLVKKLQKKPGSCHKKICNKFGSLFKFYNRRQQKSLHEFMFVSTISDVIYLQFSVFPWRLQSLLVKRNLASSIVTSLH